MEREIEERDLSVLVDAVHREPSGKTEDRVCHAGDPRRRGAFPARREGEKRAEVGREHEPEPGNLRYARDPQQAAQPEHFQGIEPHEIVVESALQNAGPAEEFGDHGRDQQALDEK
jgi:hypothetical protein